MHSPDTGRSHEHAALKYSDFTRQVVKGHVQTVPSQSLSVNSLPCREREAPSQNKAFTPKGILKQNLTHTRIFLKQVSQSPPCPSFTFGNRRTAEPERYQSVWSQAKSQTRKRPAKHPEFGNTKPPKTDVHNKICTFETGSITSMLYRSCSQFV